MFCHSNFPNFIIPLFISVLIIPSQKWTRKSIWSRVNVRIHKSSRDSRSKSLRGQKNMLCHFLKNLDRSLRKVKCSIKTLKHFWSIRVNLISLITLVGTKNVSFLENSLEEPSHFHDISWASESLPLITR